MTDRNTNATRLVEKLKSKAFVNREICETNRRQVDISITEAGLEVLTKIDEGLDDWLQNLKTVPQSEVEALNTTLDKLRG